MKHYDASAVCEALGVATNGLPRMIDEGTYPRADGVLVTAKGKRFETWSETLLRDWFSRRHADQAAYAAIGRIGEPELETLGGYVCPTESRWIWARRPELFAAYLGGTVTVYRVIGFATDRPLFGGAATEGVLGASLADVHAARAGSGVDSFTYFSLDVENPVGSFTLAQQVRAGGTLDPQGLHEAIAAGHAESFGYGKVNF